MRELFMPSRPQPVISQDSTPDNANPLFAPAFLAMLGDRQPILLAFSSGDRHRFNFGEKFEERYATAIAGIGHPYQVLLIDGANHVLSEQRWIDELLQAALPWLDRHYPARAARA
jgi:hypothetical protein